jgi:hypothetical protein
MDEILPVKILSQCSIINSLNMKSIVYKFLIVGTICLVGLGSCNERNKFDDGVFHLDIRSAVSQEPKVFNLSDIGSGISYIPLETNESCLLYQINKIKLTNDYIFITDGMSLFQFTSSGNFVRQIGRAGKGPGEYGRRITFDVDVEQQEIFIYSSSVVNVYDLGNGAYKRRFLINHDVSDLNILPQGKMVFFTYELFAEALIGSVCEVFLTDSSGAIYDSILNYDRLNIESFSRGYSTTYEFAPHEIHYMYNYRDTLYKITKDFKRSPHAVFNLENKISRNNLNFEPIHDKVQFPDFLWIPEILENAQIIFITAEMGRSFIVNPNVHYIIFDKTSGALTSTHKMNNDIDGGLAFWPRFASGEKLISHYLPTEIMNHYKATSGNNEFSKEFEALVKNLNENDNPVLVILE